MADSDTHTTTLTAEDIRRKAREFGAAAVGIGDIRHFAGCDPQRDPRAILPHATCVIGCAFRIPRALYAAMARREQFYNYTQLGVKFVDEDLAEIFLLKLGGFIEDAGYDACLQRNVSNLRIKGDKTTNPPKTGDAMGLWAAMAALSGAGLGWVTLSNKKRKDEEA